MNYYIFNRENDTLEKDDDAELVKLKSSDEVYNFLRNDCQFSDDWISKNYFIMKGSKILIPE